MRVLIAEDDPAVAAFVKKGLEAEHYAVDVTHDGEQAKTMATELDYDLFMLDHSWAGDLSSQQAQNFGPGLCPQEFSHKS